MAWRTEEILAATNGKLVRGGTETDFGEIVTNSREVQERSVFLALKGERFDGHGFVVDAVRRGAACVIVHRQIAESDAGLASVVRVADTLRALGDLAHYRRHQVAPKVLAITGSNGKTTTKEMLAAIMEEGSFEGARLRGKVLKTEGNFNNLVGLPLTLLRLEKHHKVAVVELGTSRPGEIDRLAEIADPDGGIITSVAAAHLEGLHSLAGVAREKGALYRRVRPDGFIAVNNDDPWVRRAATRFKGEKITYGKRGRIRAEARRLRPAGGLEFSLCAGKERARVRLNFLGQHNITNALGAAAVAYGAGIKLPALRRGLERARPFPMRMQLERWNGIGIINDAYNANPASMEAALKSLAEIGGGGDRIAVLGDMFELGKQSRKQHRDLGAKAAAARIDWLYLLGEQADAVRNGAIRHGLPPARIVVGADHADLAGKLRHHIKKGDWLLFKGSRASAMEKVLNGLKEQG